MKSYEELVREANAEDSAGFMGIGYDVWDLLPEYNSVPLEVKQKLSRLFAGEDNSEEAV